MNELKVLMLGWEYAPIINGGLGVACQAIARQLSAKVDLSVIIPHVSKDLIADKFGVIGLNQVDTHKVLKEAYSRSYEFVKEVEFVDVNLLPYESNIIEKVIDRRVKLSDLFESLEKVSDDEIEAITNSDLYDDNLGIRVMAYAKYVRNLVLTGSEYDVLYAHDWMTFLAAMEVKKATGKPFIAHVHSLNYDRSQQLDKGWIYQIEKEAMNMADKVVAVSQYTKNIITEHYEVDEDRIEVVHNGIDHHVIKRKTKPFDEHLVLFLGRITSQKGPETFLDIAEKVRHKVRNVRFVMAGDGDQLKKIIETGAYRSIGDRFHFTGFLNKDDVNELLSMADVLCMPSVSEPFGLTALEAAQYGVPAVISKQSGVLEVLNHALTADYWDAHKMAEHVSDILLNEELAAVMSVRARKDVKDVTWSKTSDKIIEVIKNTIRPQ